MNKGTAVFRCALMPQKGRKMEAIIDLDFAILDFIREYIANPVFDVLMPAVSFLGNAGWFWIAMAAVMLMFKKTRKAGAMMGLSLILGLILCNLTLKPLVARIRPYDLREVGELLIAAPHDFSFPSGHTTASFEGAGVLMLTYRKPYGYLGLALASVIAFSRMYLYVHYPTDILGGIIVGLSMALLSKLIVDLVYKKLESRRIKTDK